jgi:hypothetical protein
MDRDREISREELYQLVWSKPTSTVAKELGLSDVGLAKILPKTWRKKAAAGFLGESRKRHADEEAAARRPARWMRLEDGHSRQDGGGTDQAAYSR